MSVFFVVIIAFPGLSQNAISIENAKAGNPASEWDIAGLGDLTIQGFSTQISVNKGETVYFKIKTPSRNYSINIFRYGYYNGAGARKWGTGTITASLPQIQPIDLFDPVTGKTDCSNWAISAKWVVPGSAVSGVYVATLTRNDGTRGSSHITFIVRDDAGKSDLLFKTSDATWQAYNNYGGTSLYGNIFENIPPFIPVPGFGHATKVSYNRPVFTAKYGRDCFKNAEYPMVRWLERNGYDVSYTTCVDMAKDPAAITPSIHKAIFTVGHDEYWSAAERTKFENARAAGVNLGFFSGNTCFWKTRWEDNYRTLVCYKEGTEPDPILLVCGTKCDPSPEWTGLWRSGCAYPAAGGCKPENSIIGQIGSEEGSKPIEVPDTYKSLRFWRNTSIANLSSGQKATLSDGTIGFEFEFDQLDNAIFTEGKPNFAEAYPAGRVILSETNVKGYIHKVSLYKHTSGALVFGAGSIQWSWGLDEVHETVGGTSVQDVRMQQATVNLLADMSIQPASIQQNLIKAVKYTDNISPKSQITPLSFSPSLGKTFALTGTASDTGGGVVAGVEISTDGGLTWRLANGTTNWSYNWEPSGEGSFNIKCRSVDDIGNVEPESNSPGVNYKVVTVGPKVCPCTVFKPKDIPEGSQNDGQSAEVGFKFKTTVDGVITKVRFYKKFGTGGVHIGSLWANNGELLSSVTFTNETPGGWQEATFATPVPVLANTTYVASTFIESGDYVYTRPYFDKRSAGSPPIIGLKDGEDGANGLGEYTSSPTFPTGTYLSSNYWVDVEFDTKGPLISKNPTSTSVCNGAAATYIAAAGSVGQFTVKWQQSVDGGSSWDDIPSATNTTLVFNASASDNNKQYRAVFSNNRGSVATLPATLTVSATIVVSASVSEANCTVNDGSISVSASGGISPYTYSLNGVSFQSSNIFNNLPGGTYAVTVKDAINCTSVIKDIIISQSGNLTLKLTNKTDASCGAGNGTISVVASCGNPSYQYILSGGIYQSGGNFTNLSPGSYTVWVVDSKSNYANISDIVIDDISTIVVNVTAKTDENCSNKDGSVTVIASGGKSTYKYSLNGGSYQSGSTFNNLSSGTYIITAKDANNCTTTVPVTIVKAASSLSINISGSTNASCSNNDGLITVAASGGKNTYLFSLNGEQYQSGGTFSNLSAGTYSFTVKDGYGCTNSKSATITMAASTLSLKANTITNETCSKQDGSITVIASGGKSSYQYSLNGGKYQSGGTFNNLSADTYSLTVKDANGCTSTIEATITSRSTLNLNLVNVDNVDCYNSIGSITVKGAGGKSPYKYRIGSNSYQSDNTFDRLKPGMYDITVKDANNCTFSIKGIEVKDERTNCNSKNSGRGTVNSTETLAVEPGVSIYPNPAMSDFKVLLKGYNGMKVTIRITGSLGKEVIKKQVKVTSQILSVPISLAKIAKGIYFVNVISDKKMTTEKLIVQ